MAKKKKNSTGSVSILQPTLYKYYTLEQITLSGNLVKHCCAECMHITIKSRWKMKNGSVLLHDLPVRIIYEDII